MCRAAVVWPGVAPTPSDLVHISIDISPLSAALLIYTIDKARGANRTPLRCGYADKANLLCIEAETYRLQYSVLTNNNKY